jgi:tetratricopeptide (TPR) repeat protein
VVAASANIGSVQIGESPPSDPGRHSVALELAVSQRELAVSYERFGDAAMSAGNLEDARGWFDKALAVRDALAAADPSNTHWQRDLLVSYGRLGDVAVSAGKLDDARGWFDKALAVAKSLAAADPSNTQWQRDLSVSYEKLGDVAVSAGKLDDARGWLDKSLAVRKVLVAADPSSSQWQRDLSTSYEKLGEVAMRAGKLDDAQRWLDEARKVLAAAPPPLEPTSSTCPRGMVHVPAGIFLMGSPDDKGFPDQHPQHRVTLSAYCIDQT